MKYYVDCISGRSALIDLSNNRYDFLNGDLDKCKIDEHMRVINLFCKCYMTGRVISTCSRSVIDSYILLKNIADTMDNLITTLNEHDLTKIYKAALNGITESCSFHQQEYYQPRM